MKQDTLPKPVDRGTLRLKIGSLYFSSKRLFQWYLSDIRYATEKVEKNRGERDFPYRVAHHQSLVIRELKDVDLWMQKNKVRNLQLAIARLNGLVLRPGETMSLWRLVGRPSKQKGYLPGMVLVNGEVRSGYGGGLCQLSNLIYWMTLHTELTVTERYRHQYDVFPDSNRTLPFGSGATISYNYIDLQIRNDTKRDYYLCLDLTSSHLVGEWRSTNHELYQYEMIEKNHHFTQHTSGKYLRHNQIWRRKFSEDGVCIREECVAENHALMMYSPMLPSPSKVQNEEGE